MKENMPTGASRLSGDGRLHLEHDWYAGGLPPNVEFGKNIYIDTSYGFASFFSEREPGLILGDASGAYDRTSFIVGPRGRIRVGTYTVLNGSYLICNDLITIGDHCLIAWGAVITDTWAGSGEATIEARREVMRRVATDPLRRLRPVEESRPVTLENNVWVGFDAVVLPGVRLGRGCIVGSKSVVYEDVPPYTVAVGDPARPIRSLDPDDTDEKRELALRDYVR